MGYTRKQVDVLNAIHDYNVKHNCSPTLSEIGEALGITVQSIYQHIIILESKGAISRDIGQQRSLKIIDKDFLFSKNALRIANITTVNTSIAGVSQVNITIDSPYNFSITMNVQTDRIDDSIKLLNLLDAYNVYKNNIK